MKIELISKKNKKIIEFSGLSFDGLEEKDERLITVKFYKEKDKITLLLKKKMLKEEMRTFYFVLEDCEKNGRIPSIYLNEDNTRISLNLCENKNMRMYETVRK